MKRILVLNYEFPPLGGGGGVAAHKLAKGWVQLGYQVDYLTTWFPGLPKFEVVDGINIHRVRVVGRKELPTATMISMLSFPIAAFWKGMELCRKNNYEFINTQFVIPTGPLGYVLSKIFGIKNIVSLHGGDIYDPSKKSSPHRYGIFRILIKFLLNSADRVVAQSSNTKANTQKYYGITRDIEVISLPYEPVSFAPVSRAELGLKEDLFYTVSVGRFVKRKGFDFLIRSIAKIEDQNVHALIIGEGPERKNLEVLAEELGISDRIHLLGSVSEEQKFQYLSNGNIYILSSIHEGFGIVLQEAMQVGLPIISTDNGGQVDLLEGGYPGDVIQFGEEESLAAAIELHMRKPNIKFSSFSDLDQRGVKKYISNSICGLYLALINTDPASIGKDGLLVSVVIPTYNRATTLVRAINSLKNQTYQNWECIVIDDGSTDQTRSLIENFLSDSRISYFFQNNAGPSVARNLGISRSMGEYVTFLDSDDEFEPLRIREHLDVMRDSGALVSISNVSLVMGNRTTIRHGKMDGDLTYSDLLKGRVGSLMNVMIKASVLRNYALDRMLDVGEDLDLLLRLMKDGYRIKYISRPLLRVHKENFQDRISANPTSKIRYNKVLMDRFTTNIYHLPGSLAQAFVRKYQRQTGLFLALEGNYDIARSFLIPGIEHESLATMLFYGFIIITSHSSLFFGIIRILGNKLWRMGVLSI